jgi:tetratricopeptide (TPR) repeat protein
MLSLRQDKPKGHKHTKEDLEFEIRFFEGISQRDPKYIEALQILGDAYTKTGQWKKGLLIDQRLAKLCPDNALVFYNLACSYSLLENVDAGFAALERAVKLGYRDSQWLAKDPDLVNLRKDRRFDAIRRDLQ